MYNIIVTLDSHYILPLKVMLHSLFKNNPDRSFTIYMIYSDVRKEEVADLYDFMGRYSQVFVPVFVEESLFSDAPTPMHYTRAMYYRLLACTMLPDTMDKALYLDPDILAINPIDTLYGTDVSGRLFGACSHTVPLIGDINKIRLQNYEADGYYNSGVLMMNLARQRKELKADEIFAYVRENKNQLILPDQDVLNALYGSRILSLDDSLYNYDVRKRANYLLASGGIKDMDWVLANTVILHFCGKQKPWRAKNNSKFRFLYKHYQQQMLTYQERTHI